MHVYLLEMSQIDKKRSHLFVLLTSTLCNVLKAKSSLKKRPQYINKVNPWKAGSVIYFPIIYELLPIS